MRIEFKPVGLEGIVKNVKTRGYFKPYISLAMRAGLHEIDKRSFDSELREPYLFNFKNPRKDRTGFLASTMRMTTGYEIQNLSFTKDKISATTFSPMIYADYVASRNDFYSRILGDATRDIDKHFSDAVDKSMRDLGLGK